MEKNRNLILYICHELIDDLYLGSIKLNKVLYLIDISAYLQVGSYVSTFRYVKQPQGPTPDPKQFLRIKDELIASGALREESVVRFGYMQKRPISNGQFDMSQFSPEEMKIIDDIIKSVSGVSAKDLSDYTHNHGWKLTPLMGEMRPMTFFVTKESLSPDEMTFFSEMIA